MACNDNVSRRDFLTTATGSLAGGALLFGGSARAEPAGPLRAGAAAVDITPGPDVSLDGYVMKIGPAKSVHDKLHARCLVLDNGSQRVAIVVSDLTTILRKVFDRAKELAHRRTGLPTDHMMMSATHTHSAPRIGIGQGEADKRYFELLAEGMAESVSRAIDNLAPARVGWGVGQKPELVHNRRWLMKPGTVLTDPFGGTGDRVKMNPRRGGPNRLKPAGPVDPDVSFLSVQHADGRPLALLANFGIHYCGGFKRGEVSADYFGMFAERIGQLLGAGDVKPPFVGIMSNGTSGDISNGFSFREPAPRKPPYTWMREVADMLADEVYRVFKTVDHRDRVSLAMREKQIELGVRRPDKARLAWAKEVLSNTQKKRRRAEIYAHEAILLGKYPPTVRIKLQALRVGELGIGAIPCEVFAATGLAIKKASPLRPTFVIELANGYHGYLPTPEQHKLGGYETWPARSSCLEVEAATKIRATVLDLLSQVSKV